MASVNKVILIGNLGRDPELRYTPSGQAVVNFSIATTERIPSKDPNAQRQERTEWHNIVAWAKLAELCNQYLKKGRSVYIEGRLQTRQWDDRDGNKKSRTEVVATAIQFLGSRSDAGGEGGGAAAPRPPRAEQPAGQPGEPSAPPAPAADDAPPAEDDLPF